jgi:hypothetical protein
MLVLFKFIPLNVIPGLGLNKLRRNQQEQLLLWLKWEESGKREKGNQAKKPVQGER